jgi:hypothetical protein
MSEEHEPTTLVYNDDGFAWVSVPGEVDAGDLPPHYFDTLPEAVRRADELGLNPTHWQRPNGPPVKITSIRRVKP